MKSGVVMVERKKSGFVRAIIGLFKLLFFLLLIAVIAAAYYYYANLKAVSPDMGSPDREIEIPKGIGVKGIAALLENENLIKNELVFLAYCKINETSKFQAGKYYLNSSMTVQEIVQKLNKGQARIETVKFTIPEGYELRMIIDRLESLGVAPRDEFVNALKNSSYSYEFIKDIPDRELKFEGYLFPDTYEVYKNATAEDIVGKMMKRFQSVYSEEFKNRAKELNMTMDQIITLASIIEREAKLDSERKIVSSVFHNRLKTKMKLQSCATVQYLLKERKDVLTYKDLEVDSPYNTYKYIGLPPGPIASPGLKSIEAALYPDESEYLYFVAKEDGSHVFSRTYKEHLNAQNKIKR